MDPINLTVGGIYGTLDDYGFTPTGFQKPASNDQDSQYRFGAGSPLASMERQGKRVAEGYADGGLVRGPRNSVSDYRIPPEAVKRIGVDRLNALVAKYHKKASVKPPQGGFIIPADVVKKVGRKKLDRMLCDAVRWTTKGA